MSYDVPAHLIDLRRKFEDAEQRCNQISAALPSATDIASGAAVVTDEQWAELGKARVELQGLAEQIQLDPWWADVDNAVTARAALLAAARA